VKSGLLAFGALVWAAPAFAQSAPDPLAPLPSNSQSQQAAPASTSNSTVPVQQQQPSVSTSASAAAVPKDWRGVFDAIDAGNWTSARAGIATLPPSVLTPVATAELYTAKGSPVVDLASLQALIAEAPELPQANQLAALAVRRGATTLPQIVSEKPVYVIGSAPLRYRAHPVQGEPYADQLRSILDPFIKSDDAAGAEAQLLTYAPQLSYEARAEAGQRVAFAYYVNGDDSNARRVADTWRQGATGEWAAQAAWISGLASWRLGDFNAASGAFQQAARFADQRELRAAGNYWAARSEQAADRPANVERFLLAAAAAPESMESFYGLLARETLGMPTRLGRDSLAASDPPIGNLPNVQRAVQLAQIGEPALAEEMLRHQALIGSPSEHHALIELAERLDLPAAQLWLADHGQWGARSDSDDRYPNPRWTPIGGWRVDPALAFGHIKQESAFRRTAVSTAGAVGLMQVLPITAQQEASSRGLIYTRASLTDPRYNLEFGQSFIERMRSDSGTAGQLPRIIASYNAGPLPVARWATINDKGDPLLWIESLPYWETRYYVPSVMRNMWVYQGLDSEPTVSLTMMAEHRWPSLPVNTASR
jgi:soluble lytic murein transglycosylase-like protein